MILRRSTTDILRKDLRILVNGFWVTLVLKIGEMRQSLACFGVMELVSHSYIPVYVSHFINLYTVAGSGKTILTYGHCS